MMRRNDRDETLKRNYIQKYQYLIAEYEQVKAKQHPDFLYAHQFYKAHGTCAQTFLKYYNRYKTSAQKDLEALLPGKRGPRYKTRRTSSDIENMVLSERAKGCNRYEIYCLLKPLLKAQTPAPTTIYNILRRHNQNVMNKKMSEEKIRYVREKAGELAHIDCYHLSCDTISSDAKRYYILAMVDDATRLAWAEVMTDIKALSAMFATLKGLNEMCSRYDVKFAEILTDNGPEFGPKGSKQSHNHPFQRLLLEMGIKQRHTRPYRPQTNGKIERFWRTLNTDLIEGTHFDNIDHFKNELFAYLLYYNQYRPHQGIKNKTPLEHNQSCQRIT